MIMEFDLDQLTGGRSSSILKNPIYVGKYTYNRQIRGSWVKMETPDKTIRIESEWVVKESAHLPLITSELFKNAQVQLRNRTGPMARGRGNSSNYLLSCLMVCTNCGYNFHGHVKNNGYGKYYKYYEDSGFRDHGASTCVQSSVPADSIEAFILKTLDKNLPKMINKDKLRALIERRLRDGIGKLDKEHSKKMAELQDIRNRKMNLAKAIESGADFAPLLERMETLEKEERSIQSELAENTNQRKATDFDIKKAVGEIMELSKNAFSLLHSEFPSQVKTAINNFVDRVEIDHKNRKATFFVYKIPDVSKTYDKVVSVKTCRRSELHPYFNKNLLFISNLGLPEKRFYRAAAS